MTSQRIYSAYDREQWERLDAEVFGGAGEVLKRVHAYARGRSVPPVALLVCLAQYVLASMPVGSCFDAGLGPGPLSLFTALVGGPGSGKGLTMSAAADSVRVAGNGAELRPDMLALGSGEGAVQALKPDKDNPARPVLFSAPEIGALGTLMKRKGSTLRPTLLSIYSGEPLGWTNKGERLTVDRGDYAAGVMVGCQPDKAGVLLGGDDDGLRHRFVWVEVIDPLLPSGRPVQGVLDPLDVDVPPEVLDGQPVRFPAEVVQATKRARQETLRSGQEPSGFSGHRNQTRLRLAAGLSLLRSKRTVDLDDWKRAGVLMDYSDAVQRRCMSHLENMTIGEEVERQERRERAEEETHRRRVHECRETIVDALAGAGPGAPVNWSSLCQRFNSRKRDAALVARDQLVAEGVADTETYGPRVDLVQGPRFPGEV